MAGTRRRDAILAVTYSVLLVAAGLVAARFVAWQHEGWAGFWYAPAMPKGSKGKTMLFKPGAVSSVSSGGPAAVAGLRVGDVILTVNRVPTSDWDHLAHVDDQLKVSDEVTYQVQRRDGSRPTVQVRLGSPLGSRQILVSTFTSLVVALVFRALGTLVYWRKPDDERALIFYLLSLAATVLFVVWPLIYVDEFPSRGARSVAQMTKHQIFLYLFLTILGSCAQVLAVHLALIFPRRRPAVEHGPVLRWLYVTPLLQFVGFPTFALLALPQRYRLAALLSVWLLALGIVGYLVRCWYLQGGRRAACQAISECNFRVSRQAI